MSAQGEAPVLSRSEAGVRIVTLNRPSRLNAWTRAMREAVVLALDAAEAAGEAVVLTGAGERGFCAGQDFHEVLAYDGAAAADWMRAWMRFLERVRACQVPLVVALNGTAAGSGLQVALLADERIAHEGVRLGQPEIEMGVVSVFGAWLLREHLGLSRAAELVLSGRMMPCEEAHRIGLVHRVVDRGQVLAEAVSAARQLAGKPPAALRANKAWLRSLTEPGFRAAIEAVIAAQAERFDSGEPKQLMGRFLEPR
jgi:enoyl-CoA hydratase/carnithine racemase